MSFANLKGSVATGTGEYYPQGINNISGVLQGVQEDIGGTAASQAAMSDTTWAAAKLTNDSVRVVVSATTTQSALVLGF